MSILILSLASRPHMHVFRIQPPLSIQDPSSWLAFAHTMSTTPCKLRLRRSCLVLEKYTPLVNAWIGFRSPPGIQGRLLVQSSLLRQGTRCSSMPSSDTKLFYCKKQQGRQSARQLRDGFELPETNKSAATHKIGQRNARICWL